MKGNPNRIAPYNRAAKPAVNARRLVLLHYTRQGAPISRQILYQQTGYRTGFTWQSDLDWAFRWELGEATRQAVEANKESRDSYFEVRMEIGFRDPRRSAGKGSQLMKSGVHHSVQDATHA
jgi:hypothetical protein